MQQLDDDVRAFLDSWQTPTVDPAAQTELLRRLQALPLLPERSALRLSLRWAWLLARSQLRLVHPATWIASALVMALGGAVTLALYRPTVSGNDLPFVMVAPLVAALGVAFLYGEGHDPPLELQLSTPVSPHVILLARLALLFGFNLLLGGVCSVTLALVQAEISLVPLILAWLAPMTALSALTFLMSVLVFDPLVSVLICMAIWASQVARRAEVVVPAVRHLPDLLRVELYPLMFLVAAIAIAIALWLADRENRWSA